MQIELNTDVFERNPYLVRAWRIPELGSVCDTPAPSWLVERLTQRELMINSLGGMDHQSTQGFRTSIGGDYIILTEDDTIEFCKANEFKSKYKLLAKSLAH